MMASAYTYVTAEPERRAQAERAAEQERARHTLQPSAPRLS